MLVDTSVWVDFFRGKETLQVCRLEQALSHQDGIFYSGLILTEILQGISNSKQLKQVKNHFNSLLYLEMQRNVYEEAASIYRALRKKGITVRKTLDCLIAATAISYKVPLLHTDKDFLPIAAYCQLKCIEK